MTSLSRQEVWEREVVEVEIDDYGFTGEGYVRLSDGWLSVPGALPGERVRVRLQPGQRRQSHRIYADVEQVIRAAEERRDPLCERDDICRGCQLRHMTVASELAFKVRTVEEVIERYAGVDEEAQPPVDVITVQPIARGDAYRVRSRLNYKRQGEAFELGLWSPVKKGLIPMADCPALTGPVQRLIATVEKSLEPGLSLPWDQAMVDEVKAGVDGIEVDLGVKTIHVVAPTHGVGLVDIELTESQSEDQFQEQLQRELFVDWFKRLSRGVPQKVGLSVSSGGYRRLIKEPERIRIPVGRWNLWVGFEDWFHATLEPAEKVYETLFEWLALGGDERFLDVGCGIGTISLMAADQCQSVHGIDRNPSSIEAAEINAVDHGATNIQFHAGGWEKGTRQLVMDERRFDVATINPMREPLGRRVLAMIDRLGVERLVYLGPAPEAAARDIGQLRELGWRLEKLGAANLHPATYHAMLMAYLTKDDGGKSHEES